MDTPIEIFLSLIAFTFAMGVIGLWKKIPIMLFIAGAVITFWAISTDNIVMNDRIIESDTSIFQDIDLIMNQLVSSGSLQIYNSTSNIFIGEEITSNSVLNGELVNTVCVFITKTNSPPSTLRVGVYDSSVTPTFGNFKTSFAIVTATDLPVQATQLCYTIDNPIILSSGDVVGVYYDAGSSTNRINFLFQNTDVFDGTNSRLSRYSGSWVDATTNDARMIIGFQSVREIQSNTNQDNLFPFTEYPKILFGIIGAIIMLAGAMIWKYEEN